MLFGSLTVSLHVRLEEIEEKLSAIRSFMKDCCVCAVVCPSKNIPEQDVLDFTNWYKFLGVENIYILDNNNQFSIPNSVIRLDKKKDFYFCLSELKKWVKENSKEKYMILCDCDEFLFIEDPEVLNLANLTPLALNWFNMIGNFDDNLKNIAHPAFAYTFGNYSNIVKCIGKVEDISDDFMEQPHYSFKKNLRVIGADSIYKTMEFNEDNKKLILTNPKEKIFEKAWFLHLRIKSKRHWVKKHHEDSQWDNRERADNFEDWLKSFPRVCISDSRHLEWFLPFVDFLKKNESRQA